MIYMSLIYVFLLVGPAIATLAFFRRLSTGWHLFLLSLCVFYGISPLLVTWGGFGLAKHFGCSAEAVGFRCPSPAWLGDAISGMVMSHWLAIFAIPSAVLGAIGLLFSWILQQKRSRNTSAETPTAFYRSRRHKVIAGVCSALAQRWHQSLALLRIVAVVLAIVTPGFIVLYLWCWLAFPIDPRFQQQPVGERS
jgi:phage shock protein PspC (stress-responsive transcriptional regulator)